ncbi:MAG: hypothetical protein LUE64_06465 [Candidatus Gastranaerophilales bacterium]|nr:hypothetical protein [Candidatus Gastranaerophilales bacterium]
MNKLSLVLFGSVFLFTTGASYSAANYSYKTPAATAQTADSLQGSVTYVPAGATTTVMMSSELSTETATAGSTVSATLVEDFVYNNNTIATKGSVITGTIIKAKKGGYGNKNGQLQVVFNNITTPQGYNIPVNAVFKTDDNTGILKGGTTADSAKDYAKDAVVGAGAGAVLGTAMGALSSGSVGKGAIYGTALGGGLGLAKGVITKGDNITIPASSYLDIYFTQPITLSAPKEYEYSY